MNWNKNTEHMDLAWLQPYIQYLVPLIFIYIFIVFYFKYNNSLS
jgi:hypothetical protein